MGPYDHFANLDPDDESENEKSLALDFDLRKSGAMFRGQKSIATGKPHGYGFKVYPNNSVYEGNFEEGTVHGFGRGITSKGEVYQGNFAFDVMEG